MYLFVVNPRSGGGAGERAWRRAEKRLRDLGIRYEVLFTGSAGQAENEVRQALSGRQEWIACAVVGGDGTIHSVLPALSDAGVPLGIIPAGSGNDTARGFGIPAAPEPAVDALLDGTPRTVDLLAGSGGRTLTSAACGFDAQVALNVNASRYKKLCSALRAGRLAYLIGILHTLASYKPCRAEIECDGELFRFDGVWLTAVCNLPNYGGGLRIAPQARPDDGRLDLCIVHGCSRTQMLRLFPTLLKGSHVRLPFVTMLRGSRASVRFETGRPSALDGEMLGLGPLTLSCEAGAIRLISPAG